MSSHAEPSEQQLKPLVENNRAMWVNFTKAATVGAIAVAMVVALTVFIIKL